MSVAPLLDTARNPSPTGNAAGDTTIDELEDVQLFPAPDREPPFDDELVRHLSAVGPHDRPLPFAAHAPSRLRLRQPVDTFDPQPTSRAELPDPEPFLRRFVIAVIETVTGRRSPTQLAGFASPGVHAGLARDVGRIGRLGTSRRPATIHSLRYSEPADGVIEATVVVAAGPRYRAIALRLEGLDGRWRCVRLQIG